MDCAGGQSRRTYTCSSAGITRLSSNPNEVVPCWAPPPSRKTYGCAALAHALDHVAIQSLTSDQVSPCGSIPKPTDAIVVRSDACHCRNDNKLLGLGPVYLLVSLWRNAHCSNYRHKTCMASWLSLPRSYWLSC